MFVKHVGLPNLPQEQTSALSLGVGDYVMSADGETWAMVVRKVSHPHQKVLEVRVGNACMRVTPSHRVSIPSDGACYTEVMAENLKVGDLVMTSGGTGTEPITEIVPISEVCTVYAITFEPDVPIISQFPAQVSILSLGQAPRTQKPTRRSGMNRRIANDAWSIPDTAPGHYSD